MDPHGRYSEFLYVLLFRNREPIDSKCDKKYQAGVTVVFFCSSISVGSCCRVLVVVASLYFVDVLFSEM